SRGPKRSRRPFARALCREGFSPDALIWPKLSGLKPLLQVPVLVDVLHDIQAITRQADLPTRRTQHAQLAQPQVGENLRASAVATPFGEGAARRRFRVTPGFGTDALEHGLG